MATGNPAGTDDERIVTSGFVVTPETVGSRTFTTAFRGFDQGEVRTFLKRVSEELTAAAEREAQLRRLLHEAQNRAAHPEMDEAALTHALGEHAARLLGSAREQAAAILGEADEKASRLKRDAEAQIARIRSEADGLLARRVEEVDGVTANLRNAAEADARHLREQARADAENEVQAARTQGREMVAEARAVRERVLADLARRRHIAEVQLDQLRAARERLLGAYALVRRTLDEATQELKMAEVEARLAADEVARRAPDPPPVPPAAAEISSYHEPAGAAASTSRSATTTLRLTRTEAGARLRPPGRPDDSRPSVPNRRPAEGDAPAAETGPPGDDRSAGIRARTFNPGMPPSSPLSPSMSPPPSGPPGPPPPPPPPVARTGPATGPTPVVPSGFSPSGPPGPPTGPPPPPAPTNTGPSILPRPVPPPPERRPPVPTGLVPPPAGLPPGPPPPPAAAAPATPATKPPDAPADEPWAQPGDGDRVDELFARIKADRAATAAAATAAPPTGPPTAPPAAGPPPGPTAGPPSGPPPPPIPSGPPVEFAAMAKPAGPPAPDKPETARDITDEAARARRDELLDPIEDALSRQLKRILQDEQNEVLDRLRRKRRRNAGSPLLPPDEQMGRFREAAESVLDDAVRAGVRFADPKASEAHADEHAAREVATELASEVVVPLRERLERSLEDAGDDVSEVISAVYRQWRAQELEPLARHHAVAAFSRGAYAAYAEGTGLRWVVDDETPCPDCDDNELAATVVKGEVYPTGQVHPPAHLGCRCLLVPAV